MIKSFKHKGLQKFFETGSTAGIQPAHQPKLRMRLAALDTAVVRADIDLPGFRLHPLKGKMQGLWAYRIHKGKNETKFQQFTPHLSKPIIDHSDCILDQHYGFTHEKLDFIISYTIKYRMGKELNSGEEGK